MFTLLVVNQRLLIEKRIRPTNIGKKNLFELKLT